MSMPKDDWINTRAYALWEEGGREHGQHDRHWEQASREWDERERVALRGHGRPAGEHQPPVEHAAADVGIPPEELQYDTEESPAPRLGKATSDKKKSKSGSAILGKSQESKARGGNGKSL